MMQCSFPPPLTEDQLSDALDGVADLSVHEHLEHCAHCRERLAEAQRIETALQNTLYRWDAPSPDELADYVMGLLDDSARSQIEAYLRTSPSTREEVKNMRAFLNLEASPVKPTPIQREPSKRRPPSKPRLEEIIAALIPKSLQPALRGEGGISRGELTAEGRGVTIFIEYIAEGDTYTLTGQVMAGEMDAWVGALVQLLAQGRLVGSTVLDAAGDFKLPNVPSGMYDLRIASENNRVIVIDELKIGL